MSKTAPTRGWYSAKEIAAILDRDETHVAKQLLPLAGDKVQKIGKANFYHARTIIDAWTEKQVAKATPPASDDPLMSGDSPNLERYRSAKADLAEMERDAKRGQMIPAAELDSGMSQLMSVLRRANETIQRRYGNDASAILDDAIRDVIARWERQRGRDDPAPTP